MMDILTASTMTIGKPIRKWLRESILAFIAGCLVYPFLPEVATFICGAAFLMYVAVAAGAKTLRTHFMKRASCHIEGDRLIVEHEDLIISINRDSKRLRWIETGDGRKGFVLAPRILVCDMPREPSES